MADEFGFDLGSGGYDVGGSSFPSGLSLGGGGGDVGAAFPSGLNLGGSDFNMTLPELTPPAAPEGIAPGPSFLDTAKGIWGSRSQVDPRTGARTPGTGVVGGGESLLGGFSDFARGVMPVAQLGLAGLGVKSQLDAASASRDQARQRAEMQQTQRASIQPLQQFGSQQLSRAQAGQLDPAVEQMLANLAEAQKAQARQWFASQGISDSTMMESVLRDIDNKIMAMRGNVLGMDKDQALHALTASMGGAGQAVAQTSAEENQLNELIRQSNAALAALTGGTGA